MRAGDDDFHSAVDVASASFAGPGGPLEIRVYTPRSAKNRTTAGLVYLHGGGWSAGGFDTHEGFCARLSEACGCRIAMVDYRLAPEHKFPAAVEDGIAAVEWLGENASGFAIDPDRLGICGDSAGANIAAGVCRCLRDSGRAILKLQLLLCPILDAIGESESRTRFGEGYLLDRSRLENDIADYCPPDIDRRDPRISPLCAADFAGLPAAHIHTAEFDPVRDEGFAYAEKLAGAKVPVNYNCHPGMIHLFYGLSKFIPHAELIVRDLGVAVGQSLNRRIQS